MENLIIVFIHVILLALWLFTTCKFWKKIRGKKHNYERIEDVYEIALFDISIILLLMYVAMMSFGVGVWSCVCLVAAICLSAVNTNIKQVMDQEWKQHLTFIVKKLVVHNKNLSFIPLMLKNLLAAIKLGL